MSENSIIPQWLQEWRDKEERDLLRRDERLQEWLGGVGSSIACCAIPYADSADE